MRYFNQKVFVNDKEAYKRFLKKSRGLEQITQYSTPKFEYPTALDRANFETISHVWTTGDKFHKLAGQYYSDPKLWWVIAFYNQKPTEFHVKLGDIVFIPVPLETVLFYIGY